MQTDVEIVFLRKDRSLKVAERQACEPIVVSGNFAGLWTPRRKITAHMQKCFREAHNCCLHELHVNPRQPPIFNDRTFSAGLGSKFVFPSSTKPTRAWYPPWFS